MITWQSRSEESRCKTISVVLPSTILAMFSWMMTSLSGSSALVASSNSRIEGRRTSARDGEALLLPARKIDAAFFQHRVVALRHAFDELFGPGLARGPDDFLEAGARLARGDVVLDGAAEEETV